MNHDPSGLETNTQTPERILTLGGELPTLDDMYSRLSDEPDIRVLHGVGPHELHGSRKDVSEKELVDDLRDFCQNVQGLTTDTMDEREKILVDSVAGFLDSVRLLSHEAYAVAIDGLASHHADWLKEDERRRLRFVYQRNRAHSSQGLIGHDIAAQMMNIDPAVANRADVTMIEDLAAGLQPGTKLVIADDWAVSGNYIAQDLTHVYQVFHRDGVVAPVDINLLLARKDQITDGIGSLERTKEYWSWSSYDEPTLTAYYSTPAVASIYGYEAIPTGSHSTTDYGFSETLGEMYRLLHRYGGMNARGMPYAATVVPTYAHNYEKA